MPAHKKTVRLNVEAQKEKRQAAANRIKSRKHDLHKQLSVDKKEALVLHRRTLYRDSKTRSLRNSSTCDNSVELVREKPVTIREPSCLSEEVSANPSHNDASTIVPGKGKNIVGHPCIFEVGSSSAAPIQRSITTTTNKGSTSHTVEQLYSNETTARKKVNRSTSKGYWNIRQLPNNASTLKKVMLLSHY